MIMNKKVEKQNKLLLSSLQSFLLYDDESINMSMIRKITSLGFSPKDAYHRLLKEFLNIDQEEDNLWIDHYLSRMIEQLSVDDYTNNPYYQNIVLPKRKMDKWKLGYDKYQPYQAFIYRDFQYGNDGEVYPQIGFFTKPFRYPAIYENGVLWMSVTPNEIETMKKPIQKAKGKVLTCGLGLGYYAYMVSLKEDVESVTIIEKDPTVIKIFEKDILPQFSSKNKIKVVCIDAEDYLRDHLLDGEYQEIFIDLWHDAGDAITWYKKLYPYLYSLKETHVSYWIEDTFRYYL